MNEPVRDGRTLTIQLDRIGREKFFFDGVVDEGQLTGKLKMNASEITRIVNAVKKPSA
jgi:hypothetical protein